MSADPDPASHGGLGDRTGSLIRALRVYYQARVELLKLEFHEATRSIVQRIILVVVALVVLFFGWAIAEAALVDLVRDLTNWDWKYAAFAVAGGHLILAIILILLARSGPPLFEATRSELEKDKAWLAQRENEKKS